MLAILCLVSRLEAEQLKTTWRKSLPCTVLYFKLNWRKGKGNLENDNCQVMTAISDIYSNKVFLLVLFLHIVQHLCKHLKLMLNMIWIQRPCDFVYGWFGWIFCYHSGALRFNHTFKYSPPLPSKHMWACTHTHAHSS